MPTLDPDDLRRYAQRDWGKPEQLARRSRAALGVDQKVALGVALYESAKATLLDWPDEATRRADFEHHLQLKALLLRAAHVGAR